MNHNMTIAGINITITAIAVILLGLHQISQDAKIEQLERALQPKQASLECWRLPVLGNYKDGSKAHWVDHGDRCELEPVK